MRKTIKKFFTDLLDKVISRQGLQSHSDKDSFDEAKAKFLQELRSQPDVFLGIPGWNQLEGTLPGKNHGCGCKCWSCQSQLVDPPSRVESDKVWIADVMAVDKDSVCLN